MRDSVAVPKEAIMSGPSVNWRHIDGPMMGWAGNMHWLTWGEIIKLTLCMTTVDEIAERRWPHLARQRTAILLDPRP